MLHDLRGKEISEGDVAAVGIQPTMVDAIVASVSPPMVQSGPMGQIMMQKMVVLIQYNFLVPAHGQVPVLVIDKSDSEMAKKTVEMARRLVGKIDSGSGGGSVVLT